MNQNPLLALVMDQTSHEEFWQKIGNIQSHPRLVIKLGLRLLPCLTKADFEKLKAGGYKIFVDAKLHDIPSQVADSVQTWAGLGADYVTVHLSGGGPMLEAAQKAAAQSSIELLGVSVLTSMDEEDLSQIGVQRSLEEQVKALIQLGKSAGLGAFVCSANEIETLLADSPDLKLVTPGLSLEGSHSGMGDDQKRRRSIEEAINAGAYMMVLGRALWNSEDPRATLTGLLEKIS